MYVFAVVNQKGGTGKTTTTVNLAAAFARDGLSVVIVDNDSQGHIGRSFGFRKGYTQGGGTPALYQNPETPIANVIQSSIPTDHREPGSLGVERERISLILSSVRLADAERDTSNDLADGLFRLADRAEQWERSADVFIADCPGSLGALTLNAMVLVSEMLRRGHQGGLIVPVSMGMLDVDGLGLLSKTVQRPKPRGLAPDICAIVPTACESHTLITRDVMGVLNAQFNEKVTAQVRKSVRFQEAPAQGKTIFEYDPKGNGAGDFASVARDILRLVDPTYSHHTDGKVKA